MDPSDVSWALIVAGIGALVWLGLIIAKGK